MLMGSSTEARLTVERVRCFIKWHESRFDALDKPHEPIEDPVGYTRGGEHWVSPDTWRDTIFDGDESEAKEASCTLRDLGLLRVREPRWCQIVVNVRGTSCKVYAVLPAINDWRVTSRGYSDYPPAKVKVDALPISLIPSIPAPPDLAGKLEAATSLALDEALSILRMEAQLDDRTFQTILRAKSAIINTVLTNQVRVDEAKLRQRSDDMLPALLARIEAALKHE
jgi:hypothetical protein